MDNKKHNSFCAICGKSYYYCNSCKDIAHLYPYKILTDTTEHYKIFMVVRGYNNGLYTKEEAYERLKNVDTSDIDNYKDNIKKIVKDILQVGVDNSSEVSKEEKSVDKVTEDNNYSSTSFNENKEKTFTYTRRTSQKTYRKNNYRNE